eukprot:TRINITY_DN8710_c0_g1_i1.p1 TRINITY_DN8710_c0_g1~~TRINITY_DN8710_c0_g1_i1.p1  ORF type:complete len:227 (+),score=36.05 TRINITY_DN8710_c0_g1_i1:29-709(+)
MRILDVLIPSSLTKQIHQISIPLPHPKFQNHALDILHQSLSKTFAQQNITLKTTLKSITEFVKNKSVRKQTLFLIPFLLCIIQSYDGDWEKIIDFLVMFLFTSEKVILLKISRYIVRQVLHINLSKYPLSTHQIPKIIIRIIQDELLQKSPIYPFAIVVGTILLDLLIISKTDELNPDDQKKIVSLLVHLKNSTKTIMLLGNHLSAIFTTYSSFILKKQPKIVSRL